MRFRPVDSKNKASNEARSDARARWEKQLTGYPGMISFQWAIPPGGPPAERREIALNARHVPPVDLITEWETIAHANTLFENSELFANLNGPVGGAPTVAQAEEVDETF